MGSLMDSESVGMSSVRRGGDSCDLNPGTRPVRLRAASAERQRRFQQRRRERVRQITGRGGGGKD